MTKRSLAIRGGAAASLVLFCAMSASACGGRPDGSDGAAGGNDSSPLAQSGTGGASAGVAGRGEAGSAGAVEAPAPVTVCADGTTCASHQLCVAPGYVCSDTSFLPPDAHWSCAPIPSSCDSAPYAPVCGCDGRVYDSACEAYAAGVDLSDWLCGDDQTPEGSIPCGSLYCDPSDEFCYHLYGDIGDSEYECRPLQDLCGEPKSPADCCANPSVPYSPEPDLSCSVVEGNGVSGVRISQALW